MFISYKNYKVYNFTSGQFSKAYFTMASIFTVWWYGGGMAVRVVYLDAKYLARSG